MTIVISTSEWLAASAGVAAVIAPSSASRSAFSADLFHTITSWPAATNRAAMRLPIAPSPTTATAVTRSFRSSLSGQRSAGARLARGTDHGRAFGDATQRFTQVGGAAYQRDSEAPLVHVERLVGR